jgi:diacylglycerol kinase family enzyme
VAPPSVALVCNPHAGHFDAAVLARWQAALEAAGHVTTRVDSLDYARAPQRHRADVVCIVGGDGTARMVVAAGLSSSCTSSSRTAAQRYALLPAGTVNLIAREAGCTTRPDGLLAALAADAPGTPHYLGLLDGAPFLCCASVGPDSAVVARVTPRAKRRWGRAAYVLAALAQAWHWPRPNLRVRVDGVVYDAQAAFVLKGRFYAGPWTLDPAADLRRAELRVLLLPRARRRDIVRLALSAMIGPRLADPAWQRLSAQTITIESAADGAPGQPVTSLPIQADGDIVGQTPARFSLATAPIRFLSGAARQTTRDQA